jgi:hypothetical protein
VPLPARDRWLRQRPAPDASYRRCPPRRPDRWLGACGAHRRLPRCPVRRAPGTAGRAGRPGRSRQGRGERKAARSAGRPDRGARPRRDVCAHRPGRQPRAGQGPWQLQDYLVLKDRAQPQLSGDEFRPVADEQPQRHVAGSRMRSSPRSGRPRAHQTRRSPRQRQSDHPHETMIAQPAEGEKAARPGAAAPVLNQLKRSPRSMSRRRNALGPACR